MTVKKPYEIKRWFLEHNLWDLENAQEIRAAAKAAGVTLVDIRYKTREDKEAPGKPKAVLRSSVAGKSSDSGSLQPTEAELAAQRALAEQAKQAAEDAKEAAAKAAEEEAKEAAAKQAAEEAAKQAADNAAKAQAAAAAKKAAEEAAAKEAAAKAAK